MQHQTATIAGVDGLELHTQQWLPAGRPKSIVVLIHGLGEYSDRYQHVAEQLCEDGHAVYALDHRGHGRSGGMRGQVRHFDELVEDMAICVDRARAAHPGLPLFVVGHSMGALVSLRYVILHPGVATGLVVSGTAAARTANISPATIAVGRVVARVAPHVGVAKLRFDRVSRDDNVVKAYFDDPLVSKDKIRARMGSEILKALAQVDEDVPSLTLPILILHGGDDVIAEADASRQLHERIGSRDKELIIYNGLWHEIFNEPERDQVLADVRRWLQAHR